MRNAKLSVLLIGGAMLASGPMPATAQSEQNEARNAANNEVIFKNYPRRALAAGEQGTVYFKVKIDRDGHPTECFVTHSSGHSALDGETCSLILMHAQFQPMRNAEGERATPYLEGAVNWKLPGGQALSGAARQVAETNDLDKMICKRELETGSMVRYKRTCMTKREWRAASDDMKQPWAEMQGILGSTHGN